MELGALRRRRNSRGETTGAGALRGARPGTPAGLTVALIAVALATAAIYPLERTAPVVSLSVVYLPAVLLVSTYWGVALGLATSLASAAAFNFFHLPPSAASRSPTAVTGSRSGRSWVVAIAASTMAELARSRALEAERRRGAADLAAALARELLSGADTATAPAASARRVALALDMPSAAIELGAWAGDERREALPLSSTSGEQMATLLVPRELTPDAVRLLRAHVVPTEFDLLRMLVRNRGRLMTHRDLLVTVWGAGYGEDTQVLRAHIANLRRKIEPAGARRYIRTDPGVGYRFAA